MNRRALCLALVSSLMSTARAVDTSLDHRVDDYVRAEMSQRKVPGAALVVIRDARIERIASYGVANIELAVPVSPQTLFHVASISKAFTAVGVMVLVEDRKLALDDRIGTHLEGLPASWQRVKVRQLLNHTSGLPDIMIDAEVSLETVADSAGDALEILRTRPVDFEPGTQWRYNQTNYLLASLLIQKLSGLPFEQFCAVRLFAPVKLTGPVFADGRAVVANRATLYTVLDFSPAAASLDHLNVLDYRMAPIVYPAGGLNISASDFGSWLLALMRGQLISEASLRELWKPAVLNDGSVVDSLPFPKPWRNSGLGWLMNLQAAHPVIGATGGSRAAVAIFPTHHLAVVVLTNLEGSQPDSITTGVAELYLTPPTRSAR